MGEVEFRDEVEIAEYLPPVRAFVEVLRTDPEHRWGVYPFPLKDPATARKENAIRYPSVEWVVTTDGKLAGRWVGP